MRAVPLPRRPLDLEPDCLKPLREPGRDLVDTSLVIAAGILIDEGRQLRDVVIEAALQKRNDLVRHAFPAYHPAKAATASSLTRPAATSSIARARMETPRSISSHVRINGGVISSTFPQFPA